MTRTIMRTLGQESWQAEFSSDDQREAVQALEDGQLLYLPHLNFKVKDEELFLLSPMYAHPKRKNISFLPTQQLLSGTSEISVPTQQALQKFLGRFAEHAKGLMNHLLPTYAPALEWGRTSYRPVQISNRATSARKDDRRLHVDAFPASPNGGKRIIRVFSNINPKNEGRVWRVGEAFETVAKTFLPRVKKPFPGKAQLLKTLRITKQFRSLYDHYMLQMHDRMKMDGDYQKRAQQTEVHFPAGCSWIVQTDQVSHAALKGQYVLEQTFYLPVEAMVDPGRSPLRVLEGLLGRELV